MIPLNYQYPLSAWIYKTFNQGDPEFAEWLHRQGYTDGKHQYKLFTFSWLDIPKVKMTKNKDALVIQSPDVFLTFSLPMETATETFIKGLFSNQVCSIGDRQHKAEFEVSSVEKLPEPELGNQATFSCLSPICISQPQNKNGKMIPRYLSPEDEGYAELFFNNLIYRFQIANHYESEKGTQENLYDYANGSASEEEKHVNTDFDFQLLSNPKSKLVTVKQGTSQETKIRGYQFDFNIRAPEPLLKFGYDAGFGEKGSLGFGCAEVKW